MVDIVSIVIAVISLVGSLLSASLTAYVTYYIDSIKRVRETKALTDKYRDPLALSAYDLQSRCYNLVQGHLLDYLTPREEDGMGKVELVRVYTAFLVGQYLSWAFIFRREARFLMFSTDVGNKEMNRIMNGIVEHFSTDRFEDDEAFLLWRGQQMAIGESMFDRDPSGQSYCIGYAEFARKYDADATFRKWFLPIEEGITDLVEAKKAGNVTAGNRLRRLQHLLFDLIALLGSDLLTQGSFKSKKVAAAPGCECDSCGWDSVKTLPRSQSKREA